MTSSNPFSDIVNDPVQANILNIKSEMSALIVQEIANRNWTQAQAAEFLELAQPRISEIKQAKLDKFSIDFLFTILFKLGYKVESRLNVTLKKNTYSMTLVKK